MWIHSLRRGPARLAPLVLLLVLAAPLAARAADRDRLEAFLHVTGFDVALESIKLSAASAPRMIGVEPGVFGLSWDRLTREVFDVGHMHGMALDILSQTLTDPLLTHAADFYATPLGARLVEAENASHMMEDDEAKQEAGRALVAGMVESGDERLQILKRMNAAIDSTGTSVRALQEIQYRFLMAADAAGVIATRLEPGELRAAIEAQEGELRRAMQQSALAGAAFTYRDFTDAELEEYAEALERPEMGQVYQLMNAVQYEIMANRFEVLAARMAELDPGQEL